MREWTNVFAASVENDRRMDLSCRSQLIKAAARDVVDMQVHSQFAVECQAEILGGGRRFNGVFTDRHGLCVFVIISIIYIIIVALYLILNK